MNDQQEGDKPKQRRVHVHRLQAGFEAKRHLRADHDKEGACDTPSGKPSKLIS